MIRPKKSLGQNFLVNDKIYRLMVGEITPKKGEIVLEVGPGTGILTEYLAETGTPIIAVEKDRRLIPILKSRFSRYKNVKIIEGDILKFDPTDLRFGLFKKPGQNPSYKLVGNIPYFLTSHLIRIALENWPKPKLILFMVQKEVARRIIAKPPKMNLLALAVQFHAETKIIANVSKNNFRPVPKVDSALIKITPKEKNSYSKKFAKNFFKLARAAFGNKRKQILNGLINNLEPDKTFIIKKLAEAEIDPVRRPESLHLEEWIKLTKLLFPEL